MAYIIKGRTQEEKYDALNQMAGVVEIIDLRNQKKLEKLNVSNASWLKKIVLSEGCQPEISGQGDAQVEYVKIECAEKLRSVIRQ